MFIILDTECNDSNNLMAAGFVVCDESFNIIKELYYLITPNCFVGSMYGTRAFFRNPSVVTRSEMIKQLFQVIDEYSIADFYAFNTSSDYRYFPEFSQYNWYDVMKIANNIYYNKTILSSDEIFKTGRLKRGYSLSALLCRFEKDYSESHNALIDAIDTLTLMRYLDQPIDVYKSNAQYLPGKNVTMNDNCFDYYSNTAYQEVHEYIRRLSIGDSVAVFGSPIIEGKVSEFIDNGKHIIAIIESDNKKYSYFDLNIKGIRKPCSKSSKNKKDIYSSVPKKRVKPSSGETININKSKKMEFIVGDRVVHSRFGIGTVKEIVDGKKDFEILVDFDKFGEKRMIAGFARLQHVKI